MHLISSPVQVTLLAIVALSFGATAQAAERHFTYSTESAVLAPGTFHNLSRGPD